MPSPPKKKSVLIVGAGAAGMSCAQQLSESPDKFDVTIIESQGYTGGQAFSIPIDENKYGAKWMNQGVQGCVLGGRWPRSVDNPPADRCRRGSYIYHHTFRYMKKQGFEAEPVDLQVSFGKGVNVRMSALHLGPS